MGDGCKHDFVLTSATVNQVLERATAAVLHYYVDGVVVG